MPYLIYFMLYTEILNDNRDFLNLYRKGSCVVSKNVVVYFRRNSLPFNRFGITAGKKVGNAVKRNRAKRIIRQAYRENELLFPVGMDIVIVARASAPYADTSAVSRFLGGRALKEINKVFSDDKN
ncbi:MAG: ribonuclease P protein component [Oscillospiraceae bacterium]